MSTVITVRKAFTNAIPTLIKIVLQERFLLNVCTVSQESESHSPEKGEVMAAGAQI